MLIKITQTNTNTNIVTPTPTIVDIAYNLIYILIYVSFLNLS